MNKKITKTIMPLIVFVVFLGLVSLDDVYAKRSNCLYGNGNNVEFAITVNNEGGLVDYGLVDENQVDWYNSTLAEKWSGFVEYKVKNNETLDLRNWGYKYEGFSGAEYYSKTGKCPPVVYKIEYMYSQLVIFGDGTPKYKSDIESQLSQEEHTWDWKHPINSVADKVSNTIKEDLLGVDSHITYEYDFLSQLDYNVPDPVDEEVKDDGKVKEWVDPSVRPVTPLDEEKVTYSCGDGMLTGLSSRIPKFGKFVYNFMQFLIPIALVLLGTIDLIKAIIGSKEDDIKKNQSIFIKRLISAVVVFFSFALVKLILSIVAEDSANIIQCVDCVLRNSSSCIEEY